MKLVAATMLLTGLLVLPGIRTIAAQQSHTTWTVANTGNEARYRVREQLAGKEFENDAVGVSHGITGSLVLGSDGKFVVDSSVITISLAELTSDKSRRDGYIKRRTLDTENFPNAVLTITGAEGLPSNLPDGTEFSFTLNGNLKIKDYSFPTSWQVTASKNGNHITGSANTEFTFEDAKLDKPSVMVVLSVKDNIKLEYDFHFLTP